MKLSSINSLFCYRHQWFKEVLFGQRTKSVPGLEIIGLKSHGRLIQEKILFLTRYLGIKIPLARYSLCVDLKSYESKADYREFELAFLLLYWQLADVIKLESNELEKMITWGRINPPNKLIQKISWEQRRFLVDVGPILFNRNFFDARFLMSELVDFERINYLSKVIDLDRKNSHKIIKIG